MLQNKYKKLLIDIFEKHQEWEADILALLKSKNLKERSFAIMVLEEWTNSAHLELVKETFTQEKNKNWRLDFKILSVIWRAQSQGKINQNCTVERKKNLLRKFIKASENGKWSG